MARRSGLVLALALAGLALIAGTGCGEESASDASPAEALAAVSDAGAQTFAEPTLSVNLGVGSPGASYEASGLIEPERGRFRVELSDITSPSEDRPRGVIGLGGKGVDNTFEVGRPFAGAPNGCWLNPHAPVGSYLGTASVEESVRLTGAVVESLGEDIRSARASGGDAYQIVLELPPNPSRNGSRQRKQRVWGNRDLLSQVEGPIEIVLSGPGTVAEIRLRLRDYKLGGNFNPDVRDTIPRVTIHARLAPTDDELIIERPPCPVAIE